MQGLQIGERFSRSAGFIHCATDGIITARVRQSQGRGRRQSAVSQGRSAARAAACWWRRVGGVPARAVTRGELFALAAAVRAAASHAACGTVRVPSHAVSRAVSHAACWRRQPHERRQLVLADVCFRPACVIVACVYVCVWGGCIFTQHAAACCAAVPRDLLTQPRRLPGGGRVSANSQLACSCLLHRWSLGLPTQPRRLPGGSMLLRSSHMCAQQMCEQTKWL